MNRNINYTNICGYRLPVLRLLQGPARRRRCAVRPYDLDREEIARRAREAWERGATEVCMQGGIHPDYTGDTYLAISGRQACGPRHARPRLLAAGGARMAPRRSAFRCGEFLDRLRAAGLGTLPGTAAEILDDEVRAMHLPGQD